MSSFVSVDVRIRKSEVEGVISAPPSKSYTHRAFFSATLSKKSAVRNPLISEDTLATLMSCRKMGAEFIRKSGDLFFLGTEEVRAGYYNAMNSGTTLRILLSLLSLSPRSSLLDGDESLRKRPNMELVKALKSLGAEIYGGNDFRAPLNVRGPIYAGSVEISGKSSQFVTSLLFALPLLEGESTLTVRSIKSKPYIDITLDVLERSGVRIEVEGNSYHIYPSEFRLREMAIPPDYSSMSYMIAAGLIAGKVIVSNAFDSKQGDRKFIDVAKEMGGRIVRKGEVLVAEKSELEGIEFDASDTPDLVPTIAILGAVARGETKIYNAEHLRIKETDRIRTVVENLRRLGIHAEEREDGLVVKGGKVKDGIVDSFGDHRIAMAFSVLGLVAGITVKNAECVGISYPKFYDDLRKIGARVEVL